MFMGTLQVDAEIQLLRGALTQLQAGTDVMGPGYVSDPAAVAECSDPVETKQKLEDEERKEED